jgi:hypothetical protein
LPTDEFPEVSKLGGDGLETLVVDFYPFTQVVSEYVVQHSEMFFMRRMHCHSQLMASLKLMGLRGTL